MPSAGKTLYIMILQKNYLTILSFTGGIGEGIRMKPLIKLCTLGIPVICGTNYYTYLNFPDKPWKGYAQDRTSSVYDVYYKK